VNGARLVYPKAQGVLFFTFVPFFIICESVLDQTRQTLPNSTLTYVFFLLTCFHTKVHNYTYTPRSMLPCYLLHTTPRSMLLLHTTPRCATTAARLMKRRNSTSSICPHFLCHHTTPPHLTSPFLLRSPKPNAPKLQRYPQFPLQRSFVFIPRQVKRAETRRARW